MFVFLFATCIDERKRPTENIHSEKHVSAKYNELLDVLFNINGVALRWRGDDHFLVLLARESMLCWPGDDYQVMLAR